MQQAWQANKTDFNLKLPQMYVGIVLPQGQVGIVLPQEYIGIALLRGHVDIALRLFCPDSCVLEIQVFMEEISESQITGFEDGKGKLFLQVVTI